MQPCLPCDVAPTAAACRAPNLPPAAFARATISMQSHRQSSAVAAHALLPLSRPPQTPTDCATSFGHRRGRASSSRQTPRQTAFPSHPVCAARRAVSTMWFDRGYFQNILLPCHPRPDVPKDRGDLRDPQSYLQHQWQRQESVMIGDWFASFAAYLRSICSVLFRRLQSW